MNKLHFPTRIKVTCRINGLAAAGIMVLVTTRTKRKNDFNAVFGPTDSKGETTITWEDVLQQAENSRNLFLMDYGHPEADFAGEILVAPLNRDDLEQAVKAYEMFYKVTSYPHNWKRKLLHSKSTLEHFSSSSPIEIAVDHDGAGLKVTTVHKFP